MPSLATYSRHRLLAKVEGKDRRPQVAWLYIQGDSLGDIAAKLGVSVDTIGRDMRAVRQEWLNRANTNFDIARAEELARLDSLEIMARKAWERSCENDQMESKRVERALRVIKDDVSKPPSTRNPAKVADAENLVNKLVVVKDSSLKESRGQSGNPAFLAIIKDCIVTRAKMRGLMQDVNLTQNNVSIGGDAKVEWNQIRARMDRAHDDAVERRLIEVEATSVTEVSDEGTNLCGDRLPAGLPVGGTPGPAPAGGQVQQPTGRPEDRRLPQDHRPEAGR